jgi:hypothetical protein
MTRTSEGLQRIIARDDISLKTSGAETASTTQPAQELGEKRVMTLTVDITAVSGTTPTMLDYIEGSDDNVNWHTIARIGANGFILGDIGTDPTNFTTTATKRATMPAARFVRSRSVITGTTPSFTYSIGGSSA